MRLLRPTPVTLLIMLFPALLSFPGWFAQGGLFCTGRARGANVEHGLALAQLTAVLLTLTVAILLIFSPGLFRWRYVVASVCVAEAAIVAGAIAFVALDSATVVWTDCSFLYGPATNDVGHLTWLYYAWGFAIASLLYQAVRLVRYSPRVRQREPEPEPDVVGPPLD